MTGTFVHPNELGAFCAMGALVAAGLALGGRSRARRLLAGATMLILLAGLTLSFARGAWIGLALGLLYLLWTLPSARRAAVVIGVPLVVIAALAGSFSTAGKTQIQVVGERVGAIKATSPTTTGRRSGVRPCARSGRSRGRARGRATFRSRACEPVGSQRRVRRARAQPGAHVGSRVRPARPLADRRACRPWHPRHQAARAARSLGDARDRPS